MPTPDEHQALSRRRDELRQELAMSQTCAKGRCRRATAGAANPAATARRKETLDMGRTGR